MEHDDAMKALKCSSKGSQLKNATKCLGYIVSYMVAYETAQEIPINFVYSKGFSVK